MNFDQAIVAARSVAPASSLFIHLCHEVSHAAKERELPPGFHIAYDGLRVKLGEARQP
jgi:phosphoribosyl 1,2-cyclic phosphate phosphodiesterase